MEDALAQLDKRRERNIQAAVLILVVMEDALVQYITLKKSSLPLCLNPCCNGRCTRTAIIQTFIDKFKNVLILVVMEDALARLVKTQRSLSPWVLILVVMEDALALPTPSSFYFKCTVS